MADTVKFHFTNPEENTGYLLWQVTMIWQRLIKKELDKLDITHTQFALLASLAWLSKSKEMVTQIDIANNSNTDRMMVSKVLRTLQKKSLVTRKEHSDDTRAKIISLTREGQEVLQQALKIVEEVDNSFFLKLETQSESFNSNLKALINYKPSIDN